MQNKKMRRILLFFIALIGLSESFLDLTFPEYKANRFAAFSPLPALFSIGRGARPKGSFARIFIYSKNYMYKFKMDKEFYNSLGGPHHYRLIFMLKLTRAKYILRPFKVRSFLNKVICKEKVRFVELNNENVESIVVAFPNGKEILKMKCLQ